MTEPTPNLSATAQILATGSLRSRTFTGLLVAQFLAAFNDQAIHAAAMFYAINLQLLSEENAISLMPILFYAPWALFGTIAGWLADRYSKRQALVLWKIAEVGICLVALAGFYLGRNGEPILGPILCLATVFLMGTHSCFFVPAKYGVMPEILPPHLLSKGNGLLESLSFLAVILGTVSGGVLSYLFQGQEWIVGVILLGLAVVGAVASALIRKMPAANPTKPFPKYIYGPLVANLKVLLGTPSLKLALQGIAFFTFVVAFMRAAVYMLGESQNPRWDELKTSVVVGTVALGIGLGSPLAGYLSGRRIELRLVLLGAAGMIVLLIAAGFSVGTIPVLIACIVGIGFFTGFYIVPLFTLLQHKAPKADKGDMIATSNFVNVTGAIAATALFKLVVMLAHASSLAPPVNDGTMKPLATGTLSNVKQEHGRPVWFAVTKTDGSVLTGGVMPHAAQETLSDVVKHIFTAGDTRELVKISKKIDRRQSDSRVDVLKYEIDGVTHYHLIPAGNKPGPHYDNRRLPGYLFLGAAALTALILVVLWRPIQRLRKNGL